MHTRRISVASSHADSLLSQASTSSTLVNDSMHDLLLYPADEHVMLHLDHTLPLFSGDYDDSGSPPPASPSSPSASSPSSSAHNLIPSSTPEPAPKPRLWLYRQRRQRTSSNDTRALLSALFHSRWPRSESEDPIFGQTTPRALSPYRGHRLPAQDDDETTPKQISGPLPTKRLIGSAQPSGKAGLLKPERIAPLDAKYRPVNLPLKLQAPPKPLLSVSALSSAPAVTPLAKRSPPTPTPPLPSLKSRTDSPTTTHPRPNSPNLKPSPHTRRDTAEAAEPRQRPYSTHSVPRSILRSDSRLGRNTSCSVKFANSAGVRVFHDSLVESPTSDHDDKPNWYQLREARFLEERAVAAQRETEMLRQAREWDTSSVATYPPPSPRKDKDSFLRRYFGMGGSSGTCGVNKSKDPKSRHSGPPAISGPMPLVRASSLRDMRTARETALRLEEEQREQEGCDRKREKDRERSRLRKTPPSLPPPPSSKPTASPAAVDSGVSPLTKKPSVKRVFWGRKTGVP